MSDLINALEKINNFDASLSEDELKAKSVQASVGAKNNIVHKSALRKVQYKTMDEIAEALRVTFGPFGSNSLILTGSDAQTLVANYSKDGHKCLKHILYNNPIELSIQTQLIDVVSHVDNEVGDGTTSATLLSAEIFKKLCAIEAGKVANYKYISPYQLSRDVQAAVDKIKEKVLSHKRDFTLDDVYDIAFISTNGNERIASELKHIYEQFGLDVFIETAVANTEESQIKIYDGMTLDEGYSDAAYINTLDGKSSIRNAKVYVFQDPIDTIEMVSLFEKIINDNIINPLWNDDCDDDVTPTVIVAPKISRDMSETVGRLVEALYRFGNEGMITQKPPVLVVTNLLGGNEDAYLDIGRLCGCKFIKKYIDPKLQEIDIQKGLAPTPDTIHQFAGSAELVEADIAATKFVNPKEMYTGELDENGKPIPTPTFSNLLAFLEAELKNAIANSAEDREIYRIKKRLQSLKSNMVEFHIGGITIADRDSVKDLVEDAVKSCRSASRDGVGYAANFEGLRATLELLDETTDPSEEAILELIGKAYVSLQSKLYEDNPDERIKENILNGSPYNLTTNEYDHKVITSINTDIKILDAIAKIVTLMVTTEQCLVQVPALNHYTTL